MSPAQLTAPASGVLLVSADGALATRLGGPLLTAGFSVAWEATPTLVGTRLAADPNQLLILDVPHGRLSEFAHLCESQPGRTLLFIDPSETDAGRFAASKVTRPVSVSSVVERLQHLRQQAAQSKAATNIQVGSLLLDPRQRTASYGARMLPLTWGEFDLLWLLANHPGQVVPRNELHQAVTGTSYHPSIRSIDVHVSRLRKKLVAVGFLPAGLKAVRAKGYILFET